MDALKMEQPEAVSRHVKQPEAVSQHMEEAKEHLEPEQELFLSRMAELETMSSSSTCSSSQLSSDLSSRRFNFGLLAPVEVSKRIPEKSTKQNSRGKDKGYSGVLIPKDKNNPRAKKPNRKAHHDEDSENISDNSPLSHRKKDKNVSNVKNNRPADISSLVSESSAKSSDSKKSKQTSDSKESKTLSISSASTTLSRSPDSTPSTLELCSSSSNTTHNSPSLANIAAQSNNQNTKTSNLNLPQSDLNSVKGSSNPSFSIPEIGSLGKCTNEIATSSSSTSLTSLANKSSPFSIPLSIGSSGAELNSTKSSFQSLAGQNVSSSNASGPDVKMGSLAGNSGSEKLSIPKLGSLGGNSNTEKFTIPKLGSLGGTSNTNTEKLTIPKLGSLGGNSNPEKFSIPQLGSLGGTSNTNTNKFAIPSLGGNSNSERLAIPKLGSLGGTSNTNTEKFSIPQLGSLGSGTPPSTSFTVPNLQGLATDSSKPGTSLSSLSCLANLHLSSHSVPEQLANLSLENSVEDERSMKGDESSRSEDISSMILENTDADDDTQDELSLQDDIDLTSALKAAKEAVKVSPEKVEEKKEVVTHLLIADLKKIKSKLINRKPSSLGRVISLRWRWKTPREKVTLPSLFSESADRFMFTDPSPDDIVLKAQTQSKSFLSRVKSESPSSGR